MSSRPSGSGVMAVGILVLLVNVFRTQRSGRRAGNDPWQGDTLEWYTTSPPPEHNFDTVPAVAQRAPACTTSATTSRSPVHAEPAPGPWLRLTAIGASAAVLVAVVSGAAGAGTAHRVLAALALPPLSRSPPPPLLEYRRLVVPAFALARAVRARRARHRARPPPRRGRGRARRDVGHGRAHVPRRARAERPVARLRHADQAADHDAAPAHGRVRDVRRRRGQCRRSALFVATMAGLALACGGASALNHMLDRDIDVLMGKRTEKRPVAAGRVSAPHALEFGLALMALSFVLLAGTVNVLTATLALVGGLFYVIVYTRLLKRNTSQNIVIGGAAGAVPPLVGYAAATGDLTLTAIWLFLIVFFWTPPHFWALALLIKENYAAAKVPMLPVVRGERATVRQILVYSYVLIAVTLVPYLLGWMGLAYARGGDRARRRLRRARLAPRAPRDAEAGLAALPLLAALPRAALRRDGRRLGDRLMERRARPPQRCASGCWLFALCCLLFARHVRARGALPLAALTA